jgi:hypothetical protein
LGALANGSLPMRRVAQLEAERRHIIEMELRQNGLLREGGSQTRPADFGAELASRTALAASDGDARHPHHSALAAD